MALDLLRTHLARILSIDTVLDETVISQASGELDSLDAAEVVYLVEDKYGAEIDLGDMRTIKTVKNLEDLIESKVDKK